MHRVFSLILYTYQNSVPNTVRWTLIPTTLWIRHHYLHFADRKTESREGYVSPPRSKCYYRQSQGSEAYTAQLWRNTCYRFCNSSFSASQEALRSLGCLLHFSNWALNNRDMFNSIWSGDSATVCSNLGPLTIPHLSLCAGHFFWHILQRQM